MTSEPPVDADAFNAFEAAGWDAQVSGYEDFFGPITARLVDPLLDAAGCIRGSTSGSAMRRPSRSPTRTSR